MIDKKKAIWNLVFSNLFILFFCFYLFYSTGSYRALFIGVVVLGFELTLILIIKFRGRK